MKYPLRYLIFWLPALLASLLPGDAAALQIAQLFCGFFMMFGWMANSGMAAYDHPRGTLGGIFLYLGLNLLIINLQYMGILPRLLGRYSHRLAGLFSYTPLHIFLQKMLDFKIPHEVYITAGLAVFCLAGWLCGMLFRYHNPNPYRPRMGQK